MSDSRPRVSGEGGWVETTELDGGNHTAGVGWNVGTAAGVGTHSGAGAPEAEGWTVGPPLLPQLVCGRPGTYKPEPSF